MTNPYLRVGAALMHIAGPLVNAWAVQQGETLEDRILTQQFSKNDDNYGSISKPTSRPLLLI